MVIRNDFQERDLQKTVDFQKALIDILINARAYWQENHKGIEAPLTKEAIIFISRYLFELYHEQSVGIITIYGKENRI